MTLDQELREEQAFAELVNHRISLREAILIITVAALAVAWFADKNSSWQLKTQVNQLKQEKAELEGEILKLTTQRSPGHPNW